VLPQRSIKPPPSQARASMGPSRRKIAYQTKSASCASCASCEEAPSQESGCRRHTGEAYLDQGCFVADVLGRGAATERSERLLV
jgi:hypothetical protein